MVKFKCKPFIKWAGGKSQILHEINKKYPKELGKSITKYAEPFVGGGAVLFDILNNFVLKEIYISDINSELINTYKSIQGNVEALIYILEECEEKYLAASESERKEIYYDNRSRYNNLLKTKDNVLEQSALFIFLNRTCFNGLYRVNSKGEFNVPQGNYKNPLICDKENLLHVSKKLSNVQIECCEYFKSREFIDNKTFVYFDPPYRPLSETSNFTSYSNSKFEDKEQKELAFFINEMTEKGALVLASNSDPKNFDTRDNFFDELILKEWVA